MKLGPRGKTKGWYLNRATGKYHARAKIGGRMQHVGAFNTPEEAHQAYLTAKIDV